MLDMFLFYKISMQSFFCRYALKEEEETKTKKGIGCYCYRDLKVLLSSFSRRVVLFSVWPRGHAAVQHVIRISLEDLELSNVFYFFLPESCDKIEKNNICTKERKGARNKNNKIKRWRRWEKSSGDMPWPYARIDSRGAISVGLPCRRRRIEKFHQQVGYIGRPTNM